MMFLIIYSFYLLFVSVLSSATCPSNSPCHCKEKSGYLEIKCLKRYLTLDELANALNALDKSHPFNLILSGSNLGSIPSDFFADFYMKSLIIMRCNITSLADAGGKPFTGLEDKLEHLEISYSLNDTRLEFSHLRRLTFVDISYNVINEIENGMFPDSLPSIFLRGNEIARIGEKAFENLHNLESLALAGNEQTSFRRSMLPNPANALSYLELNSFDLSSAPGDLFTNLPELSDLILRSSSLISIPEYLFKPIWTQIYLMDLSDNQIKCDSNMDWIRPLTTKADIFGACKSPLKVRGVKIEDFIKKQSQKIYPTM